MNRYGPMCLLFAAIAAGAMTIGEAGAETVKKTGAAKSKAVAGNKKSPAKSKELIKLQQAEQARQAVEAQARAEEEARMRAAQEAQARAEREKQAREEQEARLRAEAEAKAKREAEIAAREKPINDAEVLMKDGKSADAYALLEPLEFERSGEVRYDYLLGIAALDSGKPDKATLAFERVLAVDPNFAGARLDMARAYYQLGDLPRARTEFQTVMTQNPPEAARATIQKYLDAIQAQEAAKQTRLTGYVEGAVGHDGNLNSGLSQAQLVVPSFSFPLQMSPYNVKMAANYFGVAAGAEVNRNVNERFALFAGADLRRRSNFSQSVFNTISFEGRAGVSFAISSANLLRLGISAGQFNLGNVHNRDSSGYDLEWRHIFSPSNMLSFFGQYARQRYVAIPPLLNPLNSDPNINNTNLVIGGAGWQHVMADGKSAMFASYYHGLENDVGPLSPSFPTGGRVDGAKRINGVRVGGQISPSERWDVFVGVGYQSGNYSRINAAYGYRRSDQLQDLTLGAIWHWDKLWSVKPQLTYSRNNSSMSIYPYDRTDVSITVRREFR